MELTKTEFIINLENGERNKTHCITLEYAKTDQPF